MGTRACWTQVKEIVGRVPLPDSVHDIEYELDDDHLGNPCVRIRVMVADDALPDYTGSLDDLSQAFAPWTRLENAIGDAIYRSDMELWPYVSLIRESQRAALTNPA